MSVTPNSTQRPRLLSKSDFKLASSCEAKLYFRENGYPDNRDYDPYLQMLAQGGYMVEALAKARYANGIHLEYGGDHARAAELTLQHLSADQATLFEGTLLWQRRLARADILQKDGNTVRLIEVKAKSFNSVKHAESLAAGKLGIFCTERRPYRVRSDWADYLEDITYQVLLLERLLPGVKVEPVLLMVDTSKRANLDDVPTLFDIERRIDRNGREQVHTARFTGDPELVSRLDVITEVNVSAEVDLLREAVETAAARMEELLDSPLSEFEAERGAKCAKCEFRTSGDGPSGFRDCWGELASPVPHVLDLHRVDLAKAADGTTMIDWLIRKGSASMHDIPEEQLAKKDGTVGAVATRQRRQIICAREGTAWISDQLKSRLESVTFPAHFVDFEVSRLALPYHSGMRPYGQVAFQWSSHAVAAPGATPVHGEWLNTEYAWPNETFARRLREEIGDSGSVLTWSKFEESTLREVVTDLGNFGIVDRELAEWIGDVANKRIVDMHEWATDDFHYPGMGGRTGIKYVMDALWKSDEGMRTQFEEWTGLVADPAADPYAALKPFVINGVPQNIGEGTGAIRAYEAMMYGVEKNDEKAKSEWRQLLLRYCGLDSLSMVLIFEHLRRRA